MKINWSEVFSYFLAICCVIAFIGIFGLLIYSIGTSFSNGNQIEACVSFLSNSTGFNCDWNHNIGFSSNLISCSKTITNSTYTTGSVVLHKEFRYIEGKGCFPYIDVN